ncbi:hypothetical protein MP228_008980 [Amoeboaphelidium protococcarum]|nr:hypothetical protein MP228_008980 [Amoeboaphelidium protococcarum]
MEGKLREYLENAVPSLMECDLKLLQLALNLPDNGKLFQSFCSGSVSTLYLLRDHSGDASESATLLFQSELTQSLGKCQGVLCVNKLNGLSDLDPSQPLVSQLSSFYVPMLDQASLFGSLHGTVVNALSPLLQAFAGQQVSGSDVSANKSSMMSRSNANSKGDNAVNLARRKLAELANALLNLQQNVDIQHVQLKVSSARVVEYVQKCRQSGQKIQVEDFADVATDQTFINQLQSDVNQWVIDIQTVTKLVRDSAVVNALQEVNFWQQLERELLDIEKQLQKDEVLLVMDLLKQAKRFHATIGFIQDTGLQACLDQAQKYNVLLKDFPAAEMMNADSMEKLRDGVILVFSHMIKKLKLSGYPVARALQLVDVVANDFNDLVVKIVTNLKLMNMPFSAFKQNMDFLFDQIFTVWDEQCREFVTAARDLIRRRGEKFIPVKVNAQHESLKDRLDYILQFRTNHHLLEETLEKIYQSESAVTVQDLGEAYGLFKTLDICDVSDEGTQLWNANEKLYMEQVDKIEYELIEDLKNKLDQCKNSNEMFRLFSKYNTLFVRPKVRAAIKDYQVQLIGSVKLDIHRLLDKFLAGYTKSETYYYERLRQAPLASGEVMWVKQLERQLNLYVKKIESVFGQGWETYADGQKLNEEIQNFRSKLGTQQLYDNWLQKVQNADYGFGSNLFKIVKDRSTDTLSLVLNINVAKLSMYKDVQNFVAMGFSVPHSVVSAAKDCRLIYPYAVNLQAALSSFTSSLHNVSQAGGNLGVLVTKEIQLIQSLLQQGIDYRWEYFTLPATDGRSGKYGQFVADISDGVGNLQNKVEFYQNKHDAIAQAIKAIEKCGDDLESKIPSLMGQIQAIVDSVRMSAQSSIVPWLNHVNTSVERALVLKMEQIIQYLGGVLSGTELPGDLSRSFISIDPIVVDIRCMLKKISSTMDFGGIMQVVVQLISDKFNVIFSLSPLIETLTDYCHLIGQVQSHLIDELWKAFATSMERCQIAMGSVIVYQSLWDCDDGVVAETLGDNLGGWLQYMTLLIGEKKRCSSLPREFVSGIIRLTTAGAKNALVERFSELISAFLIKFIELYDSQANKFLQDTAGIRYQVEQCPSFDSASVQEMIQLVSLLNQCKDEVKLSEERLDMFQKSFKLGKANGRRPQVEYERLKGEYSMLVSIYESKNQSLADNLSVIQSKLTVQDKVIREKVSRVVTQWGSSKPIDGSLQYSDAQAVLNDVEQKFNSLNTEIFTLNQARSSVGLEVMSDSQFQSAIEELNDLKNVWSSIAPLQKQFDQIMSSLWSQVTPDSVKKALQNVKAMLGDMPPAIKHYAAFDALAKRIDVTMQLHKFIIELKSNYMKERHWKRLFTVWNHSGGDADLHLGSVLENLQSFATQPVKNVINDAIGEMGIEEYLRDVIEKWENMTVDLILHRNNVRIIRNYDQVIEQSVESINGLVSMKHSPFYKHFETEVVQWEQKLNEVNALFSNYSEFQSQFIYMNGLFTNSSDLKMVLPNEFIKFSSVVNDFQSLVKQIVASPQVLSMVQIPLIQSTVDRFLVQLQKIKRSLSDFLTKQRDQYSRFYFVGDDDLLEIMGCGGDLQILSKYVNKLFFGVGQFIVQDGVEKVTLTGVQSPEGEALLFSTPLIVQGLAVVDLLKSLEAQLISALQVSLKASFERFSTAKDYTDFDWQQWLSDYPFQACLVSVKLHLTRLIENKAHLSQTASVINQLINGLASKVLEVKASVLRLKFRNMLVELSYWRNLVSAFQDEGKSDSVICRAIMEYRADSDFRKITIKCMDMQFNYNFEYLGVCQKIVQTPTTQRCQLNLLSALHQHLGGNIYGQAGTGKTETVKALGYDLGLPVVVFCCDDSFDYKSMSRILSGLCQVGAWGCFDEFNRLDEHILSSLSHQIQNIQEALLSSSSQVKIAQKSISIQKNTGIFVTMNPAYIGRNQLPDNLRRLFRPMALTKPDVVQIVEILLFSQGIVSDGHTLARKLVSLFSVCQQLMSSQPHYDFGLRAMKGVLSVVGNLNLASLATGSQAQLDGFQLLLQGIKKAILPKLVSDDLSKFQKLLLCFFKDSDGGVLDAEFSALCEQSIDSLHLCKSPQFLDKVMHIASVVSINNGIILSGDSGSGKSRAFQVFCECLKDKSELGDVKVIDPKAVSKEALYGKLDSVTREWTDGIFTSIARSLVQSALKNPTLLYFIVFDGDLDTEWIENLNSVLDDNKLLSLPNGERLTFPPNVKLVFEVDSMKYATMATVSRCGIVYFDAANVDTDMIIESILLKLSRGCLFASQGRLFTAESALKELQIQFHSILKPFFVNGGLVSKAMYYGRSLEHVMKFSVSRSLKTLSQFIIADLESIERHQSTFVDGKLDQQLMLLFLQRKLVLNIVYSVAGDCSRQDQLKLVDYLASISTIDITANVIDYTVDIASGNWVPYQVNDSNEMVLSDLSSEIFIDTLDTVRNENLIQQLVGESSVVILCGLPGSGKSSTLFNMLRKSSQVVLYGINFTSTTSPDMLITGLEEYCDYVRSSSGITLQPRQVGKKLVVFCDEINIVSQDEYGTQKVITLMRQMVTRQGFYSSKYSQWIHLQDVVFVGACNPPSDAGRFEFSPRFLSNCSVLYIDYPSEESLHVIYGAMLDYALRRVPQCRQLKSQLCSGMVQVYQYVQSTFTVKSQAHYIYSPRELTRWIRGLNEFVKQIEDCLPEDLVQLWFYEAQRLFQDRLVESQERQEFGQHLVSLTQQIFDVDLSSVLVDKPLLFSTWMNRTLSRVDGDDLKAYVAARFKTYQEEELDAHLVIYDEMIDHALRIDRVLRQPQGHLLMIGQSGCGKSTLVKFVSWLNGYSVFQLNPYRNYSALDFDEDLKALLIRAGCKYEKISFILDDHAMEDLRFTERMNTLLANSEIPGLFHGDDLTSLMMQIKEACASKDLRFDTDDEYLAWFRIQISHNLHIIFLMNPNVDGLNSKLVTSPALFNRCVLNWWGVWSDDTLYQLGGNYLQSLDLEVADFQLPSQLGTETDQSLYQFAQKHNIVIDHRESVRHALLQFHQEALSMQQLANQVSNTWFSFGPNNYLRMLAQFQTLHGQKTGELQDRQRHYNVGLDKIEEASDKISEMRAQLDDKKVLLKSKSEKSNVKLKQVVESQQEAELKKEESKKLQSIVQQQALDIEQRQQQVQSELAEAEPAIASAKDSVGSIKKQQLTEVRSMANPPQSVKMAMESVCVLLGFESDSWRSVQSVIRRDDFISSILNFDNEKMMTEKIVKLIKKDFMSQPEFNFDAVNRASKACGPLVAWVIAQVKYADILQKVGPLRTEVANLQSKLSSVKEQNDQLSAQIQILEEQLQTYKDEYSALVGETELLRAELNQVEKNLQRSIDLMQSLQTEQERWTQTSSLFSKNMQDVHGNSLLNAAFLSYSGSLPEKQRNQLYYKWQSVLKQYNISFTQSATAVDQLVLSEASQQWKTFGLPSDDFCVENAAIMDRSLKIPLIVDPQSQALSFVTQLHQKQNVQVTSFLDQSFPKVLETSVRFGRFLIVKDAENFDPLVLPLLNDEVKNVNGRKMVRLGKQDVDLSSQFKLVLYSSSRDNQWTPNICSKVSIVNFSITKANVQAQILDLLVLKNRPEIVEKRREISKLHGESLILLRKLEEQLLNTLNSTVGNLLENDSVLDQLVKLKSEGQSVVEKAKSSEQMLVEIEAAASSFEPLADYVSDLFYVIIDLAKMSRFYMVSFDWFISVVKQLVAQCPINSATDSVEFKQLLLRRVSDHISMSLEQDHLLVYVIKVLQLHFEHEDEPQLSKCGVSCLQYITQVQQNAAGQSDINKFGKSESFVGEHLQKVMQLRDFELIVREDPNPESNLVQKLDKESVYDYLSLAVLMASVRLDRLQNALSLLSNKLFGFDITVKSVDLSACLQESSKVLLLSRRGMDPSYLVQELAQQQSIKLLSTSMGTAENEEEAGQMIRQAMREGCWFMATNIHLSVGWIQNFKQTFLLDNGAIQARTVNNDGFRLILVGQISRAIPASLVEHCRKVFFDNSSSLKSTVSSKLSMVVTDQSDRLPFERTRLAFMLTWLYAVVCERMKHVPLGWSKEYEFSDLDFKMAVQMIDRILMVVANGKSNINVQQLPLQQFKFVLMNLIYGSSLENEFDQRILKSLVDSLMSVDVFGKECMLLGQKELALSASGQYQDLQKFADGLSQNTMPQWIGLPEDSDIVMAQSRVQKALLMLQRTTQTSWDRASSSTIVQQFTGDWSKFSKILTSELKSVSIKAHSGASNSIQDIAKVEVELWNRWLCNVQYAVTSKESLALNLLSDVLPRSIRSLELAQQYLVSKRAQIEGMCSITDWNKVKCDLSLLSSPQSMFVALQLSAGDQKNQSPEDMVAVISSSKDNLPESAITLQGLYIQSGRFSSSGLSAGSSLLVEAGDLFLSYVSLEDIAAKDYISIPMYKDIGRKDLIQSCYARVSNLAQVSELILANVALVLEK